MDLNNEGLNETTRAINDALASTTDHNVQIVALQCDIAEEEQVKKMLAVTVEKLGRVDYAVNAAGELSTSRLTRLDVQIQTKRRLRCERTILTSGCPCRIGILSNNLKSHETSLRDFERINAVNYRGCWLSSRAEITQMLKQEPLPTHDGRPGNRGSIVNFASQLGIVGRPAAGESSLPHAFDVRLWTGGLLC